MQTFVRFLIVAASAFAPLAWAQTWPVKPIRVIVNYGAGGSADVIARTYAPGLGEALGQPVVVENRPGAAGSIGVVAVAKSNPDGYTLLNSPGGPITVSPHLYKLGVDVANELIPVAPTARTTLYLVVRPSLPVHSVAELVAYARANPGKLSYGTPGSGATGHLAAEMLLRAEKIQATHVPYKGLPPILAALVGNQIDFSFDPGSAVPLIKSGKLRVLAVTSPKRSPFFPDTQTMAEAGTAVDADVVTGVYAPAGTPREIVMRLNHEISRIMQTAQARATLAALGAELVTSSPEEFASFQHLARERFGTVVREANIRVD